jgi:hypothetical protein
LRPGNNKKNHHDGLASRWAAPDGFGPFKDIKEAEACWRLFRLWPDISVAAPGLAEKEIHLSVESSKLKS